MPPILIAFFVMLGAMTGPPLIKGLDPRVDPNTRSKWGKPAPQEYRTWLSTLSHVEPNNGTCGVTFFALATRNRVVRLEAGEQEQQLDWSWSFARTLNASERRTVAFTFRNPVGGTQLACHEQTVTCLSPRVGVRETEVREGRCRPDTAAPKHKGGKPRLVGRTAPFTLYDPAVDGRFVDVEFLITGDVDEEWYCPAIEVTWPDETRTIRESDCPAFEERDREARFAWKFNHGFPSGEWPVKACLTKSGRLLACETVTVRVIGGGQ